MKTKITTMGAVLGLASMSPATAATIAGSDFSDAAVFDADGGAYDNLAGSTDDLDASDGVTVSDWFFSNGGSLAGLDGNAQVGMTGNGGTNPHVTKFNGINGSSGTAPLLGSSGSTFGTHSFSINIPVGSVANLESVTFDWRSATGGANQRWLAFDTSADSGIIFSEIGMARDNVDSEIIDLSGDTYQGLGGTVTFNFYAGGQGSGDIDIDTIVVNGSIAAVPEPSGVVLLGLGALALLKRRRRS